VNLAKTGGPRKLAALRQRAALIPFFVKFTGPARTGFGGSAGLDSSADVGAGSALIPTFYQSEKEQDRRAHPERCLGIGSPSLWKRAGAERCGSRCACAHLDSVKKRLLCRSCGLQDRAPESVLVPTPYSPVLAGPVVRQKSGIRAARCLSRRRVCADPRFSGAAQVARRAPDCGSPFFCLGFFGEAKKSKSPAGARPGLLAKGTCLANRKLVSHACKQAPAEAQT